MFNEAAEKQIRLESEVCSDKGEPSKKKMGKVGLLDQPGGGGGLTESQLFGKISQN